MGIISKPLANLKCLIFIGFGCIVVLSSVSAENYTGDFLTNGVGARALGLGGAYVSIADDATATYWNPAGIAKLSHNYQFCFMHAARRSGLGAFNYLSAVKQLLPDFSIGLSWIRAGIDDIPIYPIVPSFGPNISAEQRKNIDRFRPKAEDFVPTGYLSDSENAYMLTFAKRLTVSQSWWDNFGRKSLPPEFLFGVNAKWISQKLGGSAILSETPISEFEASTAGFVTPTYEEPGDYGNRGYGFDAGMLIRLPDLNALFGLEKVGSFAIGVNLQDISKTTLTWNTQSGLKESIPENLNIGITYSNANVFSRQLILSYQWQSRYGGQNHVGVEYHLSALMALRAGYRNGYLTSGVGIQLHRFRMDYALLLAALINTHFLSLLWSF